MTNLSFLQFFTLVPHIKHSLILLKRADEQSADTE